MPSTVKFPRWQDFGGNASVIRRAMNVWPPFAFAGIKVETISADWRRVQVRLRYHALTRNYVGTQFGGSLFAMTDPFWMILVLRALGERDYIVWDKAGEIEFVSPGRSAVTAEFMLTDEVLDEVRAAAESGSKVLRWFETEVRAADGTVVARVRKQLYIRKKQSDQIDSAA